jgi:hypothetical protein
MEQAKIALSAEELRLVQDAGVILTKNAIIRKVYDLFGALAEEMRRYMILPAEVALISPKISRGESYQELPYVMLDYPRFFTTEDVLAIRTFFWWGHFFSVTLHVKGKYQSEYLKVLLRQYDVLVQQGYFISVCDSEWQHHAASPDYRPLSAIHISEFETLLRTHPFVKLTRIFSLERWEEMPVLLKQAQEEVFGMIESN